MRNKLTSLKYTGMLFYCNSWWVYFEGNELGPYQTEYSAYYNLHMQISIDRLAKTILRTCYDR